MNRRQLLAAMPAAAGMALATHAGYGFAQALPKVNSTVRGVKLGVTSSSFNPFADVPGKPRMQVLAEMYRQAGVGFAELGNGTFPQPNPPGNVRGHPPPVLTPEYTKVREELRRVRLSPESVQQAKDVRRIFDNQGVEIFSMSSTFQADCTDAEIDAMMLQIKALGVNLFHTNQTRVEMIWRLAPFIEKHNLLAAMHPHAATDDSNEIARTEELERLLRLSANYRVCLDIGHLTAGNQDVVGFLKKNHAKITHLHVKDRKKDQGPNVAWGTGDTPI